ncbi:MAG: M81 family metallopeptidase, partial [Cyclobacteriaceae bacterium]
MKKLFSGLIPILFAFACNQTTNGPNIETAALPRIAIAGLAIESSTFSPAKTHEDAFHARVGD